MDTFGEWVGNQRKGRRLTREELAQRVGCSVAMLRKIEADERRPSTQIAELIASAFEVPPAERGTFVRVARGELGVNRLRPDSAAVPRLDTLPAATMPRANLPLSPAPLIGRQRELAELRRQVGKAECRMLTLVGPGGVGKTRLAVDLAAQLQDDFADGVYFAALAPVSSTRFIVPVIAEAIGFAFQSADFADPKTQLLNHAREKQMLLLVDNAEHVLREPGIELLADLIDAAPRVKLLVTSREPLGLRHEWIFEVGGLPVPEDSIVDQVPEDTSVGLFLQRARRAYVGFDATTDDYPAIVKICQLTDGMPLAIELAASWVRTLTCQEIAEEIHRSVDFLTSSARDVPARHRSMRAVFDHSWQLLSDAERQALGQLSVFRGGFGREAAEDVAGATVAMLSALVTKSLVRRPAAGRYDLHELIRQYGAVQLDVDAVQAAQARQRHFDFFLRLAEEADLQLKGPAQQHWLRSLELEHDNLHAALEWSLHSQAGDPVEWGTSTLRLAGALRWFWRMRSLFQQGRSWLLTALGPRPERRGRSTPAASGVAPPASPQAEDRRVRARALAGLALLTDALGEHAAAHKFAEESAAIFRQLDDKQGLGEALMLVGQSLRWQGSVELARSSLNEALTLLRDAGAQWDVAQALYRLGSEMADFGGDAAGRQMLEESASILEALGDRFIYVNVLISRGILAFSRGDYTIAEELFDQGLSVAREIKDPWGMADALTNLGCVLRVQGDYDAARLHFEQALEAYQHWGRSAWCADPLCALSENAMSQGDLSSAGLYLQEAAQYSEGSRNSWLEVLVRYFQGLLAYYQGDFNGARNLLERAIAIARESWFQPDLSRSLVTLGRVLRAQGKAEQARLLITEGLSMFVECDCRLGIATALEALAGVASPENVGRAASLLGTAEALRTTVGAPLPPVDRLAHESDVAEIRARLGERLFAEAWQRGQAESYSSVVAELLTTFRSKHPPPAGSTAHDGLYPRPTTALGST